MSSTFDPCVRTVSSLSSRVGRLSEKGRPGSGGVPLPECLQSTSRCFAIGKSELQFYCWNLNGLYLAAGFRIRTTFTQFVNQDTDVLQKHVRRVRSRCARSQELSQFDRRRKKRPLS